MQTKVQVKAIAGSVSATCCVDCVVALATIFPPRGRLGFLNCKAGHQHRRFPGWILRARSKLVAVRLRGTLALFATDRGF